MSVLSNGSVKETFYQLGKTAFFFFTGSEYIHKMLTLFQNDVH